MDALMRSLFLADPCIVMDRRVKSKARRASWCQSTPRSVRVIRYFRPPLGADVLRVRAIEARGVATRWFTIVISFYAPRAAALLKNVFDLNLDLLFSVDGLAATDLANKNLDSCSQLHHSSSE